MLSIKLEKYILTPITSVFAAILALFIQQNTNIDILNSVWFIQAFWEYCLREFILYLPNI